MSVHYLKIQISKLERQNKYFKIDIKKLQEDVTTLKKEKSELQEKYKELNCRYKTPIGESFKCFQPGIL